MLNDDSDNSDMDIDDEPADDASGHTLLHLAVLNNDLSQVKILVESGSPLNLINSISLKSPFDYAVELGHKQIAKYLLSLQNIEWFRASIKEYTENDQLDNFIELIYSSEIIFLDFELEYLLEEPATIPFLVNYLSYYGYDPIEENLNSEKIADAIHTSIHTSFKKAFITPRSHAGDLIVRKEYTSRLRQVYQFNYSDLANDQESSIDWRLLKQADHRFELQVLPYFQSRFTSSEDLEKKLYALLLERKLAQLDLSNSQHNQAFKFITENKEKLIDRVENIMKASHAYFNSHDDTIDIVLRAFDPYLAGQTHEKLFVSPQRVLERQKVGCAYLAATDPDLSETERQDIFDTLVFQLAEISRANNHMSPDNVDNPSCPRGTSTRLDIVYQKHPKLSTQYDIFEVLPAIFGNLVVKAYRDTIHSPTNQIDPLKLLEALLTFSNKTALKIIHAPTDFTDSNLEPLDLTSALKIVRQFFKFHFGKDAKKGIDQINKTLKDYALYLEPEDYEITFYSFIKMGNVTPETAESLNATYLAYQNEKENQSPQTYLPQFAGSKSSTPPANSGNVNQSPLAPSNKVNKFF